MERPMLVVLAVIAVAVVAVGLSAAATVSDGDSTPPASEVQRVKPSRKAVSRPVSNRRVDSEAPVVVSSGRSQSSQDVTAYWTKERMEEARPMEKTLDDTSGSRSSSPSPTPSGVTVPGRALTRIAPVRKPSAKKAQSTEETGVLSAPTVSTPNYWTDEAMADAQPIDNTRPGGSGSQSDPSSGGITAPGAPPP